MQKKEYHYITMKTTTPQGLPDLSQRINHSVDAYVGQFNRQFKSVDAQSKKLRENARGRFETALETYSIWQDLLINPQGYTEVWSQAQSYAVDAAQRWTLTLDLLRQRSTNDRLHEEAGTPPVLDYQSTLVMDACTFDRPSNYKLLRIEPPVGCEIEEWKRPFMIVDPRAGHGAGIGGFKADSQVGVALRGGHPVYFVVFDQHPLPGQTLADVLHSEARFLREISHRHPHAPTPVVIGNCQGGWATLLLAATHPELTGPLVINGAPVATWSGNIGENPMRYMGGLRGGIVPALLAADLGNGTFDGAHLVSNFESLNPGRNYFGKYYDIYANIDTQADSFLEFERWWGGYHFTNEAEIRWIVEQLFVGNRLATGEAQLEPGLSIDLRDIQAPIIVFASRGDNITPPQQALNWVADTFTDEHEIRVRGQRIVYMVHDTVGHLGIFVSASIARKEHAEVSSTLRTIEALAPGLYEMHIDDVRGEENARQFVVSFSDRKMSDLLKVVPNDRAHELDFAAVASLSDFGARAYEIFLRPFVQSMASPATADWLRKTHPARLSRQLFSEVNPLMRANKEVAAQAREARQPAPRDNHFVRLEQLAAHATVQTMDLLRDAKEATDELTFLTIYGSPSLRQLGEAHRHARATPTKARLRELPDVQLVLGTMKNGGMPAAVIRMLILLADSRGSVRRDRLERSNQLLTHTEPFRSMGVERRASLIREQSVIVEFEPKRAMETLSEMFNGNDERRAAMDWVHFVVGDTNDMEAHSLHTLQAMHTALGLEALVATPAQKPRPRKVKGTKAPATKQV